MIERKFAALLVILLLMLSAFVVAFPIRIAVQEREGEPTKYPWPTPESLKDDDWNVRRAAFGQLIGAEEYAQRGSLSVSRTLNDTIESDPSLKDVRTTALIHLLDKENAVVRNEERLSEEYVNYYGDVIAAVATLRDPRSLNVMVDAITTGGMATRTLISFGPLAVLPIALKLESDDVLVRSSASWALSQAMLQSEEISMDPSSRTIIKTALTRALSDPNHSVRRNAILGLVSLGDADSISLVEKIAKADPYRATDLGIEGRYLVREEAEKALRERLK